MTAPQDQYGQPQQQPAAPPVYTPPTAPASTTGGKLKSAGGNLLMRLLVLGVVVVVILVGGYIWQHVSGSPDVAKAGDCVKQTSANDIKVVKCTDSSATFKVLGKIDNKTQDQANADGGAICSSYAATTNLFWKGKQGQAGYILCLGPVS